MEKMAVALAIIALIGGCTIQNRDNRQSDLMKICLDKQMEWKDGNCLSPPKPNSTNT